MESHVERIVDLALDQSAADPKSRQSLPACTGVNASRDRLLLEALLPRPAGVRHDQLLADDKSFDLQFRHARGHGCATANAVPAETTAVST